jgi:hypothetical protein
MAAHFSRAAGRPIASQRFPEDVLASNPFLAGPTLLVDDGRLAGNADLAMLRKINPELLTFRSWRRLTRPDRKNHLQTGRSIRF